MDKFAFVPNAVAFELEGFEYHHNATVQTYSRHKWKAIVFGFVGLEYYVIQLYQIRFVYPPLSAQPRAKRMLVSRSVHMGF